MSGFLTNSPESTVLHMLETHFLWLQDKPGQLYEVAALIAERRAKVKRVSILFAREGAFDPEHQALCCQWQEVQDGFAFSMPIFCKTKTEPRRER